MIEERVDELMGMVNPELDAHLRDLELQRRRLDAELALAVTVAEKRMLHLDDGHRSMKQYLRGTFNCSGVDAYRLRRTARLVDTVDGVFERWVDGHIGTAQVQELARLLANPRCGDQLGEFAPALLEFAEHLPYDDFCVVTKQWEQSADLDGAHKEADATHDARTAHVSDGGDGGVDLHASGGDPVITAEMIAIFQSFSEAEFAKDVAARAAEFGEAADEHPLPRSARNRCFDAILAIFRAAAANPDGGGAAEVVVNLVGDIATFTDVLRAHGLFPDHDDTAPADTDDDTASNHRFRPEDINSCWDWRLFNDNGDGGDADGWGSDNHGSDFDNTPGDDTDAAPDDTDGVPAGRPDDLIDDVLDNANQLLDRRCETDTGIVIHPDHLLRAALTGHIRRVVIDAAGVIINQGELKRLFTGSARIAAKLLARHCSHNGCDIPAALCDVDHMDEWAAHNGRTDQHNSNLRCKSHNWFKTRKRWRTRRATNRRVYSIRPDGTIVLPVGERPPTFPDPFYEPAHTAHLERLAQARYNTLIEEVNQRHPATTE